MNRKHFFFQLLEKKSIEVTTGVNRCTEEEILEYILQVFSKIQCPLCPGGLHLDVKAKEFAVNMKEAGLRKGGFLFTPDPDLLQLREQVFDKFISRCEDIADLLDQLFTENFVSNSSKVYKVFMYNFPSEVEAVKLLPDNFMYEGKRFFYTINKNIYSNKEYHGQHQGFDLVLFTLMTEPDAKIFFSKRGKYTWIDWLKITGNLKQLKKETI